MPTRPCTALLVAIGLVFAQQRAAGGGEAAAPAAERAILFGADFGADRPPATRSLFYEAGLNGVRLTGGGYGWAADGHASWAAELAKHGVGVYLQLGSHYPSADYFAQKDAWLVDQQGATGIEDHASWAITYDGSAWPQYAYANQGFRDHLAKDFTAYLTHFPPSHRIAGVILHNEPGMHWLTNRLFDYSPASVAGFRAWLPSQHGDIATLNRRWGTHYASFAEVVPPGKPPGVALAAWMDWRRWQVASIADFLRWEAGFAQRVRPDLARTTNLDGPTNNWYAYRCADLEAYSAAMDTVGMDIYPSQWSDRAFVPYALDQLRGVAHHRRAEVIECEVFSQRSPVWKPLSEAVRADLLRSELWTMYGHGIDGVMLWGFSRSDEFSLTDGEYNLRVRACRDLSHELRMLHLGAFRAAPAAVAVCLDPDAYIRSAALESHPLDGGSQLDSEFHGMHAALADAGYPVDVVFAAQLRAGAARSYRAIIVPAAPLMDAELAENLRAFVTAGGTLMASAGIAEADRWGAPAGSEPAFGLDALFGASASAGGAASGSITDAPGGTPGVSVSAPQLLVAHQAEVLGHLATGSPGITRNRVGTGQAILIAGAAGGGYLGGAPGLAPLLAGILLQAGIPAPLALSDAARTHPDAAILDDAAGNHLVVVAAQGARGSAAVAADAVTVGLPGATSDGIHAAFAFPGTSEAGGMVTSGPRALAISASGSGCTLALGTVSSAVPVLLAHDAGPLLSLATRGRAAAGSSAQLSVTVWNPSPTPLSGTLDLDPSAGSIAAIPAVPVTVAPFGSTVVQLSLPLPAAPTPRLPLGVLLHHGGAETAAIPIDIRVE